MYCITLPLHINVAPWSRIFTKPHFSTKKCFFSQKKKRQFLKKLMSESGSTLKAKVMLRWTNFDHTFIYLEILVSISPRRSSILFVKDFSLVPKFSYGEMINK